LNLKIKFKFFEILLEILVASSFSPSAQKQEAGWVYAFFFPKRSLAKKKFFCDDRIIFKKTW